MAAPELLVLLRYLWADQLAVDLANRYRSAYVLCYLLSAVVVFIGEARPVAEWAPIALDIKFGLVLTELLLVGFIIYIYRKGRRQHWHERWIEYRALAEMLRDLRFLAYLAEYGRIQRADIFESASASWFLWYLRATVRELVLPHAVLDGTYQYSLLMALD